MRGGKRFTIVLVMAALLVSAISGTALAKGPGSGKGGGGKGGGATTGGGTISVVLLDSTDGTAHWGQRVTFNVTTTATTRPFVQLNCYVGTTWVSTASAGFFPDYPWSTDFYLSSSMWTSGAGDCKAILYSTVDGSSMTTLATLSFHVYA